MPIQILADHEATSLTRAINARLVAYLALIGKKGQAPSSLPAAVRSNMEIHHRMFSRFKLRNGLGKPSYYYQWEKDNEKDLAEWLIRSWHNTSGTPIPKTPWTPNGKVHQ